ncbi:MAG: hypothetical protein HY689_13705 [Chloroflexi bacterium]|nr:hypothetical protein [Chloroflexota bacterium]
MCDGKVRETSITLTPVGEGRFEIYLDGQKLYDRKEAGDADFYPSLREIRKVKRALEEALAGAPA